MAAVKRAAPSNSQNAKLLRPCRILIRATIPLVLAGCYSLTPQEQALSSIIPPSLVACLAEENENFSTIDYQSIADLLRELRQESAPDPSNSPPSDL